MSWTIKGSNEDLSKEVEKHTGKDIKTCYQCGKCTAGCPVATYADYGPRTIMHLVQLGERERALRTSMIWLCAGCEACTTRCPRDVGPSHVIDALRQASLQEGYYEECPPTVETIPIFHQTFLDSVRVGGRLWELFMVGAYKVRSLDLFSDTLLGAKMFFNRKLSLLPPHRVAAGAKIMRKIRQLRIEEAEEREEQAEREAQQKLTEDDTREE